MNLLLLDEKRLYRARPRRIAGRRHRQLLEVIKAEAGQVLQGGNAERPDRDCELLEIGADAATLRPDLTVPPPETSPGHADRGAAAPQDFPEGAARRRHDGSEGVLVHRLLESGQKLLVQPQPRNRFAGRNLPSRAGTGGRHGDAADRIPQPVQAVRGG